MEPEEACSKETLASSGCALLPSLSIMGNFYTFRRTSAHTPALNYAFMACLCQQRTKIDKVNKAPISSGTACQKYFFYLTQRKMFAAMWIALY